MHKFIMVGCACLSLLGCERPALEKKSTNNVNFNVELLFEHEGCRVYRFSDGDTKYFVNCQGKVMWNETYQDGQGHTYTTPIDIPTGRSK